MMTTAPKKAGSMGCLMTRKLCCSLFLFRITFRSWGGLINSPGWLLVSKRLSRRWMGSCRKCLTSTLILIGWKWNRTKRRILLICCLSWRSRVACQSTSPMIKSKLSSWYVLMLSPFNFLELWSLINSMYICNSCSFFVGNLELTHERRIFIFQNDLFYKLKYIFVPRIYSFLAYSS